MLMQWRRAQRPTLVPTPGAVADAEHESGDSDSAGDGADLERDKLRNVGIEEVRARSRIGAGREVRRRAIRPSSLDAYTPQSLLRPCPCAHQFQFTSRDPLRLLARASATQFLPPCDLIWRSRW